MLEIRKVKPYFIETVYNDEDFTNLQHRLFSKGYKWLSGQIIDNAFLKFMNKDYPFFISNLPFSDTKSIIRNSIKRSRFKEYSNDIIFISEYKSDFDLSLLRIEKLIKLRKINDKN